MNECDPLFDDKPLKVLDPSLYAPCSTCGMMTHSNLKVAHECPEPLPYETARDLAAVYSTPGMPPISPHLYAQIKMGLESQAPPIWVNWSEVIRHGLSDMEKDRVLLLGLGPDDLPRLSAALEAVSIDHDACEVCGAGPQGRCDPPDDFDGECPHGCWPER